MKSATFTVLVGLLAVITGLAASIAGIPGELGQWLGTAPPVNNRDAQVRDLERRIEDIQARVDELEAGADMPAPALTAPTITRDDIREEARRAAVAVFDERKGTLRAESAKALPERIVVEADGGSQDLETLFDAFAERREERRREEQRQLKRQKIREGLEKRRERSAQMADRFAERITKDLELDENQSATVQSALSAFTNRVTDIQLQQVDGLLDKDGAKAARKQAVEEMNLSVESSLTEEQFAGFQKRSRKFSEFAGGRGREDRRSRMPERGGFNNRRGFRGNR